MYHIFNSWYKSWCFPVRGGVAVVVEHKKHVNFKENSSFSRQDLKENVLQLGFKDNHATIASSETSWNEATSLKTGQTGPQAWRVW